LIKDGRQRSTAVDLGHRDCEDEDGPVVLEGHARLTAHMLSPDALPPELEVLVGSSPKMAGWGLY
jgi:hypothetical protein